MSICKRKNKIQELHSILLINFSKSCSDHEKKYKTGLAPQFIYDDALFKSSRFLEGKIKLSEAEQDELISELEGFVNRCRKN